MSVARPRLALAAAAVFAALAVGGAAYTVQARAAEAARSPSTAAMDLLPLYLGADALAAGQDPNDPQALAAAYQARALQVHVGGFFSYYPRTASLLLYPVRGWTYRALVPYARLAIGVSLAGAAVLGVLAGAGSPTRAGAGGATRGLLLVALCALALAMAFSLRITLPMLRIAQPGPVAALFSAMGLYGLARGRPVTAGVAIGVGAAIKLFPGLLLFAALAGSLGRVLGAAVLVGGALLAASLVLSPHLGFPTADVVHFLTPDPFPGWGADAVRHVWERRFWLLPPTALALAWAAWRRLPAAPVGALVLAAGGTLLAGTHHLHESVQLVPVLGWLLGSTLHPAAPRAAFLVPAGVGAVLFASGAFASNAAPASLCFVLVGIAAWLGCAARMGWERGGADREKAAS